LGVLGQVLLGYLTVEFDLWPPVVMGHFLLSIVLITVGLVLYERAGWPEVPDPDRPGWSVAADRRPPASPAVATLGRWLLVAGAAVVLSGTIVTGTGPHGGDPDAERLPFDILDVARIHGIAMIVFLASTLLTLVQLRRAAAPASTLRAGTVLVTVLVAQAAVGYAQYLTGVPPLLVGIHVLGAALVWLALIHFWLALRPPIAGAAARPSPRPERLAVATR
jgi:heme a synthase